MAALALDNIGYATNADHGMGCNIHPAAKQFVSERLAAATAALVYKMNVQWKSPSFLGQAFSSSGKVEIKLSDVSGLGLELRYPANYESPGYGNCQLRLQHNHRAMRLGLRPAQWLRLGERVDYHRRGRADCRARAHGGRDGHTDGLVLWMGTDTDANRLRQGNGLARARLEQQLFACGKEIIESSIAPEHGAVADARSRHRPPHPGCDNRCPAPTRRRRRRRQGRGGGAGAGRRRGEEWRKGEEEWRRGVEERKRGVEEKRSGGEEECHQRLDY